MPNSRRNTHHTITVLTAGDSDWAQVATWRPIANAWPAHAPAPCLDLRTFADVLESRPTLGDAILIVVDAATPGVQLLQVLHQITEQSRAAVLLRSPEARVTLRAMPGVLEMVEDTDPGVIAATLSALAERQTEVESLNAELRNLRRFHGGLSGEMARLHDELQLAAAVQMESLPTTMPTVPNIDFQVLFRPCGYVSGDIYDVQRLDEHHVGFFVADAVGHGVPAALMTMIIGRSIITKRVTSDSYELVPPREVLWNLNESMLQHQGGSSRFATAAYGIIDCRDRRVTLAGAGHPPALRIRNGEMTTVDGAGPLLGVFSTDAFEDRTFVLEPDEVLVIHSDGFETAFPHPEADEYARKLPTDHYLDQFTELAGVWSESLRRDGRRALGGTAEGLQAAMRHLRNALDQQVGSLHQVDDLTAMVIAPSADQALDRLFAGVKSDETADSATQATDRSPSERIEEARGI